MLDFLGIIFLILLFLFVFYACFLHARADIDPKGKVIIITGAASGIGFETALQSLKKGAIVYAVDLSKEKLEKVFSDFSSVVGHQLYFFECDISSQQSVDNFKNEVIKLDQPLFALVNNAAVLIPPQYLNKTLPLQSEFEYNTDTWFVPLININLLGTIRMTSAFMPLLLKTKNSCLLNVASIAGYFSLSGNANYGITKFGVTCYTACLRRQLRSLGVDQIRIISIHPGPVFTPLLNVMSEKRDTSGSMFSEKLSSAFQQHLSKYKRFKSFIQKPESVANVIFQNVFCSSPPLPHVIVDLLPYRLAYQVLNLLPWSIQDILFPYLFE